MHTREFLQTLHMRDMLGIVVLFTNNFMRHQDTNPHFTAEETDNRKIEGKKKKSTELGGVLSLNWPQTSQVTLWTCFLG